MEQFWNEIWKKAREKYGNELPTMIQSRLSDEEKAIRLYNNENAYAEAAKIVSFARKQGGKTFVRGCAGSSFVSYLLGITNGNPLPVHYYCPVCHRLETVKEIVNDAFDLPPKPCDQCNTIMQADGHNLQYEFFLGENGERKPYFDIGVSPELFEQAQKVCKSSCPDFQVNDTGKVLEQESFSKKDNLTLNAALSYSDSSTKGLPPQESFSCCVTDLGSSHGTFTEPVAFAFRDDIFDILTRYGVGKMQAFEIAEYVRKGRAVNGFTEEQKDVFCRCAVPDNIVVEFSHVEYVFPKAHAIEFFLSHCSEENCRTGNLLSKK